MNAGRWIALLLPLMASASRADEWTSDDALLDEVERRAVAYFWNEADPTTGIVKDRANNFGAADHRTVGSVAATGFGLAALAIGAERGWLERDAAAERVRTTLGFFLDQMPHEHGWFYHFVDIRTGARVWQCEVSSIDTALFLAGALCAGACFAGTDAAELADALYRRTDFAWMLTDGGTRLDSSALCHGWKPETGFLSSRWDSYCELMILYLLAIGSPTRPISDRTWDAWARPVGAYAGFETFRVGPLFVHQFSHAFVDFRGRKDRLGFDYWEASVQATLANRQFCADNAARFRTYAADFWGLSACDGPDGYRAYSAPPGRAEHDGTVAPLAVVAALPMAPELALRSTRRLRETFGDRLWGAYGFADAFNLDRDWWDADTIGIDVGAALLMVENYRTGFVWKAFGGISAVSDAMARVGF